MSLTNNQAKALHLATHSGWYRFEWRSGNWTQTHRALTYWNMTCLQIDPEDPSHVYLGTEHSGLFISNNGGADWKRADPNVPRFTTTSMLALPGKILVGTVPAALYCAGTGAGWQELEGVRQAAKGSTFPPSPELGSRTRSLAIEPQTPHRLYAGIEVGGMLVSDDGGSHWEPANAGLDDPDVHQILPSTQTHGLVVAVCGEGIFRSMDRGAHWKNVTPPGPRTYGTAVAEDREGSIYLAMALGRPNTWLRTERADAAIFVSRDGAQWELITDGLRGGVLDVCTGVDGRGAFAATSEGEVVSINGEGCRTIVNNLPCINALALGA